MPSDQRSFDLPVRLRTIVILVTVLGGLVAAAAALSNFDARQQALGALGARLTAEVNLRGATMEQQVEQLRLDTIFLANVPSVQGVVRATLNGGIDPQDKTPEASWVRRLQTIFMAYSRANPELTKVRLIGVAHNGLELVRVNETPSGPVIVPPGQLQEKGGRNFFTATATVPVSGIYVSDLDLNREHGKIEFPPVPTLRATTPVFGPDGKLFGMIVVNLGVQPIFDKLRANLPAGAQIYLTNSRGDYLLHPDPAKTFGFDLGHPHRWQDDFAATSLDRGTPLAAFQAAAGIVHTVSYRIGLDNRPSGRFLVLTIAAPDSIIAAEVRSALFQMVLGLSVGALIIGALIYLYWLQRRTQRRATVEQARLAAIVENSSDAIIGKTPQGVITDWNRAAEQMFGYAAHEAIGRSVLELLVPHRHQAEEAEILARVTRGETVPHLYTQRRRRDGSELEVSITVSPIRASNGKIVGAAKTLRDISAQKSVETALREAQARLVFTTQASGIGLWEYNLLTGELRYDDAMFALYGIDPDSFTGTFDSWTSCLHPDDAEAARYAVDMAALTASQLSITYRIVTSRGEIRHISSKANVILDEAGKAIRMLGTNSDVTKERDREKQIAELNATLEQQVVARTAEIRSLTAIQRAILTDAAYPIITTDVAGIITLFNPAAHAMLGYDAEELVGKQSPGIFHDPAEVVRRADELTAELGRTVEPGFEVFIAKHDRSSTTDHEWTYIRKDGSRLPVLITSSMLRDDAGNHLGYLGMVIDLSERRRHEQSLRESERFLRSITNNLPAMVSYWDTDLICRFANDRYGRWFGKTVDDMQGVHISAVLQGEQLVEVDGRARAVLNGEVQQFELVLTGRDGDHGYLSCHFVPDIDEGSVRGFYALGWDITELKQAQFRLESANTTLIARSQEAEAANIAKSRFLANMSHEIRSPMNAILGMLLLLQRTDLTAHQRGYAASAYSATQALLSLLNDILDFSKIEADKIEVENAAFATDRLMRDLSEILSASLGAKDVELLFSIDPALPRRVKGDVFRLRQVLLNLAGNAVKFTERGEIVISMQVIAHEGARSLVEFSVRDTGIGIAAEKRQEIFEGFSQGESSTTRRYGGTGLGLAISQRLVSLMGGALEVESEPGVGSRFHFQIWFDGAGDADDSAAQPASGGLPKDRPVRVLVVDDHQSARDVLLVMTRSLGWIADSAENGDEALELLRRHQDNDAYDVVFIDWKMPGLDGFQTASEIRRVESQDHKPIIIMVSAHGRETLAERVKSAPGILSGLLVKPVTASMLFDAVLDASGGPAGASALPSDAPLERLTGLRLLVVEDNRLNQQIAEELLSGEGANVTIADGGVAGVAAALAAVPPFDAVLMDIQMPDLDGYDACRAIRRHERLRSMPIIAMTANVMASEKAACIEAGMNGHIAKPIHLDTMVATLLEHCGNGQIEIKNSRSVSVNDQPLTQVSEIDLNGALHRIGGNQRLYAKIAERFIVESSSMSVDLPRYLENGDLGTATSLLHTLKGTAGAVGAQSLATLAKDLELALKDMKPKEDTDDLIGQFSVQIEKTNAALTAIIAQMRSAWPDREPNAAAAAAASPGFPPIEKAGVDTILNELEELLKGANMRAVTVFGDLQRQSGELLGERLKPLAKSIDQLNFKEALAECHALRGVA